MGVGCSALLASSAIAVGAYFLLAGKQVTVPNLVGRDAGEAADIAARARPGDRLRERGVRKVPRDEVISQDPKAGEEVREGTTVTVKVSGGRGTRRCRTSSASRGQGRAGDRDAGFKAKVEAAFSDRVPEGDVISVSPAGTQATKGRTITLTVSKGGEGVEVPRLTGLQREEAEQQLNGLGLTVEVTEQESSSAPGTVI